MSHTSRKTHNRTRQQYITTALADAQAVKLNLTDLLEHLATAEPADEQPPR